MRAAACIAACMLASPALADSYGAKIQARIGSITAPFYTAAQPTVHSSLQAYSWELEGWARLAPQWSLGARLAIATSSVEEPASAYAADYTFGNPLLYVERDHAQLAKLRTRATIGVPVAGTGDAPSFVRDRVVAASNALDGWRSLELYQPGTIPLVLEASLDHERPIWRARARAKLATFVRVMDAELPEETDQHRIGLVPSAEVALAWRARRWLDVGLGAHIVVAALPPIEPIRDVGRSGRVHAGVTPQLQIVRGGLAITLDLLVAIAGPLDGTVGFGVGVAWRR